MISFIVNHILRKIFLPRNQIVMLAYELFATTITIVVLYQAGLSYKFNYGEGNVFSFLVVGEIALILPLTLAERIIEKFQNIFNQQFFQTLSFVKIDPYKYLLKASLKEMLFPLLRLSLLLSFSFSMFAINVSMESLFLFLCIQFMAIFLFYFLGSIAIEIFLWSKKGLRFYHTLNTIAALLGGAYFPADNFPIAIKEMAQFLPHSLVLTSSRAIFSGVSSVGIYFLGLGFWISALFVVHKCLKNRPYRLQNI